MKIDAYSVRMTLNVMLVISYFHYHLASKLKVPLVFLLIDSGLALKHLAEASRGLIIILLFFIVYEGVLFIVIVLKSLMMTFGLLLNKQSLKEKIEDII